MKAAPGIARRFSSGSDSDRPKDPRIQEQDPQTTEEEPLVYLTLPATPPKQPEHTFEDPTLEEVTPFAAELNWSEVPELDELLKSLSTPTGLKRVRDEEEEFDPQECIEE